MPSFRIGLPPHRRAAARFVSHVCRTIQQAYVEEQQRSNLTQSEIARRLGVHRSVINRELRGYRDVSLARVAEYAWALGREIVFELPLVEPAAGSNRPAEAGIVRIGPLPPFVPSANVVSSNVVLRTIAAPTSTFERNHA